MACEGHASHGSVSRHVRRPLWQPIGHPAAPTHPSHAIGTRGPLGGQITTPGTRPPLGPGSRTARPRRTTRPPCSKIAFTAAGASRPARVRPEQDRRPPARQRQPGLHQRARAWRRRRTLLRLAASLRKRPQGLAPPRHPPRHVPPKPEYPARGY